jgi:hypothetical protein
VASVAASDEAAVLQSPLATSHIGALAGHWLELVHAVQEPSIEHTGWPGSAEQSLELVQPGSHIPLLQNGVDPLQSLFVEHSGAVQTPDALQTLVESHGLGDPRPSSEHCESVTQHALGFAFVQPATANDSAQASNSFFMSPLSATIDQGCLSRAQGRPEPYGVSRVTR